MVKMLMPTMIFNHLQFLIALTDLKARRTITEECYYVKKYPRILCLTLTTISKDQGKIQDRGGKLLNIKTCFRVMKTKSRKCDQNFCSQHETTANYMIQIEQEK